MANPSKYRETLYTSTYYQPSAMYRMKYNIADFEVWENLENAKLDYPDIPDDEWLELHDDDIDEPTYMD